MAPGRRHHAFSDRPGDPDSPYVDHGVGVAGKDVVRVSPERQRKAAASSGGQVGA